MRAIFGLLVLVGCSYAMPQELGASPVIEADTAAAADTPAAVTNVEAEASAADVAVAEGDVNRQGLIGVNAQVEGGAGDAAGGAGGEAGGAGGAAGGAGGAAAAGPACSIYGCAFYGPGLNNPAAMPPNAMQVKQYQDVAVANPNLRVFVGADGILLFTDVFGRETEVVDQFGLEIGEPIDPVEQQELAQMNFLVDIDRRTMAFRAAELAKLGLDATGMPLPQAPGAAPFKFPTVQRIFTVATQAA